MTELETVLLNALLDVDRLAELETSRIIAKIRRRTGIALDEAREIRMRDLQIREHEPALKET